MSLMDEKDAAVAKIVGAIRERYADFPTPDELRQIAKRGDPEKVRTALNMLADKLRVAAKRGERSVTLSTLERGAATKLEEWGYKVHYYTPYGPQDDGINKPSVTVSW